MAHLRAGWLRLVPMRLSLTLAALLSTGCADDAWVPVVASQTWPEADALFRGDPHWLGGDGAYSIPLGNERVLWLFGDSFVAKGEQPDRTDSEMVRNTLAIQTGADPTTASLSYAWRADPDGSPAPFFADHGDEWHWPGHGVRLPSGPLVVFLLVQRPSSGGLGFEEAGWRVVTIENPDDEPLAWKLSWHEGSKAAALGTAAFLYGDFVYATASAKGSQHEGWLARFSTVELAQGTVVPAWWGGASLGWGASTPAAIMSDIGSECSLHFEPRVGSWLHVASRGFGATTIAVRTSKQLTGPWSPPEDVMTPPASRAADPFVYAAKAHPELAGPSEDDLIVTYATNSFEFSDLFTPEGQKELYWPRFVRLTLLR